MLEKIERDFSRGSSSYPPYINLTEEQVEWLIEQAKRAKRMEEYIKNGLELGYIDDREKDYKRFME